MGANPFYTMLRSRTAPRAARTSDSERKRRLSRGLSGHWQLWEMLAMRGG